LPLDSLRIKKPSTRDGLKEFGACEFHNFFNCEHPAGQMRLAGWILVGGVKISPQLRQVALPCILIIVCFSATSSFLQMGQVGGLWWPIS